MKTGHCGVCGGFSLFLTRVCWDKGGSDPWGEIPPWYRNLCEKCNQEFFLRQLAEEKERREMKWEKKKSNLLWSSATMTLLSGLLGGSVGISSPSPKGSDSSPTTTPSTPRRTGLRGILSRIMRR